MAYSARESHPVPRLDLSGAQYVVKQYCGQDDWAGVEHRFEDFALAQATAEALGKRNFDAYNEAGAWHPVVRDNDGQWRQHETLAEIWAREGLLAAHA